MPSTQKRCAECKFCTWERLDEDSYQSPRCDNSKAKHYFHLLKPEAQACRLFCPRPALDRAAVVSSLYKNLFERPQQLKPRKLHTKWQVVTRAAELLAIGVAGAGASNLDKAAGIMAFGGGLFVALTLFVGRSVNH